MPIDMESEKRCASTSSSSCASVDALVKTEIEAAETLADLAHLAMRHKCSNTPPHSDLPPSASAPAGQADLGQQPDQKFSTTESVEIESIQQDDDCLRHMKVEQDTDLPKTTNYSSARCSKPRRNLTEEEKEARRIRRVLANRESARQTIRRRQALCEELTRKAANLALENENLRREKEMALREYRSLETTNKHLKAQIAKSINTEVEKTAVEQDSSVAEVATLSGKSPWFLYNRCPVTRLFWPSLIQSSNPVQLQRAPFNSIAMPSNLSVPHSSESDSCHKQNNLIHDNRVQNPLYLFPSPWLFPLPEFGNGQSAPSIDKQDELPLGKQCRSSSSLSTVANVDRQAALPIKLKTEVSGWTEARPINDPGRATTRFPLDGSEEKTGCNTIQNFCGPSLDCNGHTVQQEHELQLHSAPNTKVSSTASHIATSSLENKQAQLICPGKNLVDAVAAAEARKRRKELTKLRSIHNRQS